MPILESLFDNGATSKINDVLFVLGGLPYVLGLGNVSVNIQLKEKILVQTKLKF